MEKKSLEENIKQFNGNERTFICTEALRIFSETDDGLVALEALRLLERTAQPY